jgi:hypothetical protein
MLKNSKQNAPSDEAIDGIFMPVLPPRFNCEVKHTPLE